MAMQSLRLIRNQPIERIDLFQEVFERLALEPVQQGVIIRSWLGHGNRGEGRLAWSASSTCALRHRRKSLVRLEWQEVLVPGTS